MISLGIQFVFFFDYCVLCKIDINYTFLNIKAAVRNFVFG